MRPVSAIVASTLLLSACALQPVPQRGEIVSAALPAETTIPAGWTASDARSEVRSGWLRDFHDPALDAIVNEALAHNPDLRVAAEQVRIARQYVVLAGAGILPQLGAQVGAQNIRDKDADRNFDSARAMLGMAWELDVWGRLRSQRSAAVFGAEAAALDYRYARESLAALVAKSWYLTLASRELVELAEQTVETFQKLLELVEVRRKSGKDSDLNVMNVRAKVATARSDLASAQSAYAQSRRTLEILLGRYPSAEISVSEGSPTLSELEGVGVPLALLGRRPDIAAAERTALAAFRMQESARLSLLPDVSFSLSGGRLNDQVLSLLRLNPWLAIADIGLSIPIYTGGALQANVEIASAQQAQAIANYGASVLGAFEDVENALAGEQFLQSQLNFEEAALTDRTEVVRIADTQYRAGKRDLLWVAQLQSAEFLTAASVIKLRSARIMNRIDLYLALGARFEETSSPESSLEQRSP
ncbi:efflux transporter outer membrane subunit [Dokdonella sp.]|uniref:efflux transporter outer membrane subunit n=1 Tax=Dokdonella sp. TaxID=2291710 RepID=UPI0035295679